MKVLKALGLLPILIALSFTASFANDFSKANLTTAYQVMVTQAADGYTVDTTNPRDFAVFKGPMTSLNRENHEIVVKTQVPGLLGPMEREFPFKVENDTIITVCFKSRNQCNSSPAGVYGWSTFTSIESLDRFSSAKKNVTVVEEINTGRVVRVQIDYYQ